MDEQEEFNSIVGTEPIVGPRPPKTYSDELEYIDPHKLWRKPTKTNDQLTEVVTYAQAWESLLLSVRSGWEPDDIEELKYLKDAFNWIMIELNHG